MLTRLALEGFRCRAGWVHCFLMHSQKLPLPKALEQTCLAVKVLCSSEEFSPLDISPGIFGTDAMLRISHKGAVCFYKLCVLEPETVFFRLFMFTCLFFFLSFLDFFFLNYGLFKTLLDSSQGEFLLLSLHVLAGLR